MRGHYSSLSVQLGYFADKRCSAVNERRFVAAGPRFADTYVPQRCDDAVVLRARFTAAVVAALPAFGRGSALVQAFPGNARYFSLCVISEARVIKCFAENSDRFPFLIFFCRGVSDDCRVFRECSK